MGEIEHDKCDICNKITGLQRKYYYYDIKCDCCNDKNDNHFEIVRYCSKCTPSPPRYIKVYVKPLTIKDERKMKLKKIK